MENRSPGLEMGFLSMRTSDGITGTRCSPRSAGDR